MELELQIPVNNSTLDVFFSVKNLQWDCDDYDDEFGTVRCGYSLAGYDFDTIEVYSSRRKTYVPVSLRLKNILIDILSEDYHDEIEEAAASMEAASDEPDPDYARDLYYGY